MILKRLLGVGIFCLLMAVAVCGQNYTVSGYITDGTSGESLITSSVFDYTSRKGTVTNNYGFYSITLPKGQIALLYSYAGYNTQSHNFKLAGDTIINIKLSQSIELNELTVVASQQELGIKGSQMSAINVPVQLIKTVPTLFGESDVVKTLQLLPGVQAGTEGSSGFYVRGGGPDENLFLLDGVPVYNVNHIAGFFRCSIPMRSNQ